MNQFIEFVTERRGNMSVRRLSTLSEIEHSRLVRMLREGDNGYWPNDQPPASGDLAALAAALDCSLEELTAAANTAAGQVPAPGNLTPLEAQVIHELRRCSPDRQRAIRRIVVQLADEFTDPDATMQDI